MIPFFQKKIVQFLIESPKLFNRSIKVTKPLLKNTDSSKIELDAALNDLKSIDMMINYLFETNDVESFKENGAHHNQALFSIHDLYLSYSKQIIEMFFDENYYQEMVKKNRCFWDMKKNYHYYLYDNNLPILGFKDLIECSARIVEIKHYNNLIKKYESINLDKQINDSYFYDKNYFRPLEYIKLFFDDTDKDIINNFLLIAIHVSINPSIAPFFNSTWDETNSISDIHPGIRLLRICIYIKTKYTTLENALSNSDLYNDIIEAHNWKTDSQLFNDFQSHYQDLFNRVKIYDDHQKSIDINKIYDIEYIMYKYFLHADIKRKYNQYFIDPTNFFDNFEKFDIIKEIDSIVHCPVFFNTEINKYQVNASGIEFTMVDDDGNFEQYDTTKKDQTEYLSQEFLNVIITGLFYNLDSQLLHSNDIFFDLSILDLFDISDEIKKELIGIYENERKIKIS